MHVANSIFRQIYTSNCAAHYSMQSGRDGKRSDLSGKKVRIHFHAFIIGTMEELYHSILDHKPVPLLCNKKRPGSYFKDQVPCLKNQARANGRIRPGNWSTGLWHSMFSQFANERG